MFRGLRRQPGHPICREPRRSPRKSRSRCPDLRHRIHIWMPPIELNLFGGQVNSENFSCKARCSHSLLLHSLLGCNGCRFSRRISACGRRTARTHLRLWRRGQIHVISADIRLPREFGDQFNAPIGQVVTQACLPAGPPFLLK